ncbi:MAG: hypothetical protein WAL55_02040 [Candidatus Acidiferrales bacterium]
MKYLAKCAPWLPNFFALLLAYSAILIFARTAAAQTSVVIVRTPEQIWIGADSKVSGGGARPTECKTRQISDVFVTTAILGQYAPTGFDVHKLASDAFRKPGSILDRAKIFERDAEPETRAAVQYIRASDPEYFKIVSKDALEVAVAGVENGDLVLDTIVFHTVLQGGQTELSSEIWQCPGDCTGDSVRIYLGEHDAIEDLYRTTPTIFDAPPEKLVPSLVQIEILDKPGTVGPPISLLSLTKDGATWLQQGVCDPIKK